MTANEAETHRLIDTALNPRLHVYLHLALWQAWFALAKAGRNPPLYTKWKREAWENIGRRKESVIVPVSNVSPGELESFSFELAK